MTNHDGVQATWQTPALEPLTDACATADVVPPIRNGGSSLQVGT